MGISKEKHAEYVQELGISKLKPFNTHKTPDKVAPSPSPESQPRRTKAASQRTRTGRVTKIAKIRLSPKSKPSRTAALAQLSDYSSPSQPPRRSRRLKGEAPEYGLLEGQNQPEPPPRATPVHGVQLHPSSAPKTSSPKPRNSKVTKKQTANKGAKLQGIAKQTDMTSSYMSEARIGNPEAEQDYPLMVIRETWAVNILSEP